MDMKRLLTVMKWDFQTNRNEMKKMAATTLAVFTILYALTVLSIYWSGERHTVAPESVFREITGFNRFFIVMEMIWAASMFLYNLRTKERRTTFLMLPASTAEKFAVRWLYVTVGTFLLIVVSLLLADLVLALFCLVAWPELLGSVTLATLRSIAESTGGVWNHYAGGYGVAGANIHIIYMCVLAVTTHSFFLYCSAKFRRQPLLPAFGIVLLLLFVGGSTGNYPILGQSLAEAMQWDESAVVLGSTVLLLCVTVLLYRGSYRLLKQMPVVCDEGIESLIKL